MSSYFFMSKKFDKCNAYDFGLINVDGNTARNPKDNSIWIKTNLFDFGWGKENGYYKYPLPTFSKLIQIVLNSTDYEDTYGAASIILDKYSDELLKYCENIIKFNPHSQKEQFLKLIEIFKLDLPINRSNIHLKSISQIYDDCKRWKNIADASIKAKQTQARANN